MCSPESFPVSVSYFFRMILCIVKTLLRLKYFLSSFSNSNIDHDVASLSFSLAPVSVLFDYHFFVSSVATSLSPAPPSHEYLPPPLRLPFCLGLLRIGKGISTNIYIKVSEEIWEKIQSPFLLLMNKPSISIFEQRPILDVYSMGIFSHVQKSFNAWQMRLCGTRCKIVS